MNERIEKLYKQASKQDYFPQDGEEVYMSAEDLKKFAELLVKECATIANRAENTETELRCMYDVITEHFGVEE